MSVISWDEQLPSGTSSATSAVEEFRSMLTAMAVGLGESTFWPGSAASQGASAASAGELIPGSARLAINFDNFTGGKPNGFLGFAETEARLWHIGSVSTEILAHGHMQDRDGGLGSAPFGVRWLVQTDITPLDSDRTTEVTFATPYNGVPTVDLGPGQNAFDFDYGLRLVTASGFTILKDNVDSGATPTTRFMWRSEGTVNL